GAFRHARHPLPALVELARCVASGQQSHRFRMVLDGKAEGLADGIGGDVVLRGADAPGGKNRGVACAKRGNPAGNLVLDVRYAARFAQIDAETAQEAGNRADIHVLGAAGQNFIADDERGCGYAFATLVHRPYPKANSFALFNVGGEGKERKKGAAWL